MKKNFLFAAVIILLAVVISLFTARGEAGARAKIEISGGETQYLSLAKDGVYAIEGAALPVTLEVKDGKVRFIDSQCPDHICEGFGWVSTEYDTAVCMPAGVVLSVEP